MIVLGVLALYVPMSVLLLTLPCEIWQDVFATWLGELHDVIHVDFACGISHIMNPLRSVYYGGKFQIPGDEVYNRSDYLNKLCAWMKARNVCVSKLTLKGTNDPPLPEWENVLSWSGAKLESLYIENVSDPRRHLVDKRHTHTVSMLSWAAQYVKQLREFQLVMYINPYTREAEQILQSNSSTLVAIIIDAKIRGGSFALSGARPCFPHLQVLHIRVNCLCELLRGCPNLQALSVPNGDATPVEQLVSTLAKSCSQLRRLRIDGNENIVTSAVLQIANSCPQLVYLSLVGCGKAAMGPFADVVNALPQLHTLVVDDIAESTLLEIAALRHPTLQALDTLATFTYAGLRQFTASMPPLTVLGMYSVQLELHDCNVALLEHCRGLEVLQIGVKGYDLLHVGTTDAVLASVAAHCHNLRTLTIMDMTADSLDKLDMVLQSCPRLRTIGTKYWTEFAALASRRGLNLPKVLKDEMVDWMPGWDV